MSYKITETTASENAITVRFVDANGAAGALFARRENKLSWWKGFVHDAGRPVHAPRPCSFNVGLTADDVIAKIRAELCA